MKKLLFFLFTFGLVQGYLTAQTYPNHDSQLLHTFTGSVIDVKPYSIVPRPEV